MSASTLLALSGPGFALSDYALRGLTAELEPIAASANVRRTINGALLDLSAPQFRKYRVRIRCTDQESPGFAVGTGVWPGMPVTVTLIPQLGAAAALTLDALVKEPWTESRAEWDADSSWTLVLESV